MLYTLSQSLKLPSPSEDPDAVKALFGLNLLNRSQHKFHTNALLYAIFFLDLSFLILCLQSISIAEGCIAKKVAKKAQRQNLSFL